VLRFIPRGWISVSFIIETIPALGGHVPNIKKLDSSGLPIDVLRTRVREVRIKPLDQFPLYQEQSLSPRGTVVHIPVLRRNGVPHWGRANPDDATQIVL